MRFSIRTMMIGMILTGAVSAIWLRWTHDYRTKMRITDNLLSIGASSVTFDAGNLPCFVKFDQPLTSDRIALICNPIDCLDFSGTHITDASIINMRRLHARWVSFAGSDITDEQVELLVSTRSIRHLVLKDTTVSDAIVPFIRSIDGITYVDLTGTSVSQNGVEQLRESGLRVDLDTNW